MTYISHFFPKFILFIVGIILFFHISVPAQSKATKQDLQRYIVELGLDKQISLSEFWKRSKYYFPASAYSDFEEFVSENPNLILPSVELNEITNSINSKNPLLILKKDKQIINVEISAGEEIWLKINSQRLSPLDLAYPDQALKRVETSDIKFNSEAEIFKDNLRKRNISKWTDFIATRSDYVRVFGRWIGFQKLNSYMWANLSVSDKVEYVVRLRLMNIVLNEIAKSLEREWGISSVAIEDFNKNFVKCENIEGTNKIQLKCDPEFFGNISNAEQYCQIPDDSKLDDSSDKFNALACESYIVQTEKPQATVLSIKKQYSEAGIDKKFMSLNQHFEAWIEREIKKIKLNSEIDLKKVSNFQNEIEQPLNLIVELCGVYFEKENPIEKLTSTCANVLASWNKFIESTSKLKQYTCHNSAKLSDTFGPNSRPHEACICESSNDAQIKTVGFNEACEKTDTIEAQCDFDLNKLREIKGQKISCECDSGAKIWNCRGSTSQAWTIAALSVPITAVLHSRAIQNKKPPVVEGQCPRGLVGHVPDCHCEKTCPAGFHQNPNSCDCQPNARSEQCTAPLVGVFPHCGCPSSAQTCAPAQKIYNMNTCQCTGTQQPMTCPNNMPAPGGNLELCPKCRNGSFMPVSGCPSEGGTGNSCPQGGCNGGMPTGVIGNGK